MVGKSRLDVNEKTSFEYYYSKQPLPGFVYFELTLPIKSSLRMSDVKQVLGIDLTPAHF